MGPDPASQGGRPADPQGSAAPSGPSQSDTAGSDSARSDTAPSVRADDAADGQNVDEQNVDGHDAAAGIVRVDPDQLFEAQAVSSFIRAKESSAVREALDRARVKRHKAIEEEAIASWLRARKTS